MTKVKICGLKSKEDIRFANQLNPDYVGFVFAKSSRKVTPSQAKKLIKGLNKNIKTVGVFLNTPIKQVQEIANECPLDILQFHGDEDPDYCSSFSLPVWKAFRVQDNNDLKTLGDYHVHGFLLDTFVRNQYGGTGKAFRWNIARKVSDDYFIILAGGLTPTNVREAIKTVRPSIVDISSGVEISGQKNFRKMKHFIENVRQYND